VTVVALDIGEVLSIHLIEPAKGYWCNNDETPADGRGPRRPAEHRCTDDATHVSPMSRHMTLARPEGSEHALPTIVIEAVDALVAALQAA